MATKRLRELEFPNLPNVYYTIPQDYDDLENKPNISTNETDGGLDFKDSDGNIIGKMNADGLKTTKVDADAIFVGGKEVALKEDITAGGTGTGSTSGGSIYIPHFAKYKGSATSATTTSGTPTTVALATKSFSSSTTRFSLDNGGVKCSTAGVVRLSGEIRIQIPVSSTAGTIEAEIYCGSDRMFRSGIYLPANAGATGTPLTIGVSGGLCKISGGSDETFFLKITSSFATTYYPNQSILSIDYVGSDEVEVASVSEVESHLGI